MYSPNKHEADVLAKISITVVKYTSDCQKKNRINYPKSQAA